MNEFMGFTGAPFDAAVIGYSLGHGYRWYLPELKRFNATDSFSPFGLGGISSYAYAAADPISHTDPSGHLPWGGALDALDLAMPVIHHIQAFESVDRPNGLQRTHSLPFDIDTSSRISTAKAPRVVNSGGGRVPASKRRRLEDQPSSSSRRPVQQDAPIAPRQLDWDLRARMDIAHLRGRLNRLQSQMAELRAPIATNSAPHTGNSLAVALNNIRQVFLGVTADSDILYADLIARINQIAGANLLPDLEARDARLLQDHWGTDPIANAERVRRSVGGLHDLIEAVELQVEDAENLLGTLGQDFSTGYFQF